MSNYKNCPSCNSDLVTHIDDYGKHQIFCTCCHTSGPIENTKNDCITGWNRLIRSQWFSPSDPPTMVGKYLVQVGDDVSMIEVKHGVKRAISGDEKMIDYEEVNGLPLTIPEYFDLFKIKAWTNVILPANKPEENKNVV